MLHPKHLTSLSASEFELSRRRLLATAAGIGGLSLPGYLQMQSFAASSNGAGSGKAKSCIIPFCWGGMSHLDTLDLKPEAPVEIRGEFSPIWPTWPVSLNTLKGVRS